LLGQTIVADGFTSISFEGQNDFSNRGYWNSTNSGAILSFPEPNGSTANRYVVRIMFKSDSDVGDTLLYPIASEDPDHAWQTPNTLNETNSITVIGGDGMSGSTAVGDDIETAKTAKWQDNESFQFVIITYQLGFGVLSPDEHIFDGTWHEIHEEDGPHNRSTTWDLSLTSGTDTGYQSTDNHTNEENVSYDIAGSFSANDSILLFAEWNPADGWTTDRNDANDIYLEVDRLIAGVTSKEIGPLTRALTMNGTEGRYYFYMVTRVLVVVTQEDGSILIILLIQHPMSLL